MIAADVAEIAYFDYGPRDGQRVILLHGFSDRPVHVGQGRQPGGTA